VSGPQGIRRRLTLSLLLVFVLGLGAVAAFSHLEMRWAEDRLRQRALETHARELLAGLSVSGDGRVAIALLPDWEEPYRQPGAAFAFTLYDAAGRPVVLSPNIDRPLPLLELPPQEVYGGMHELADVDGRVALAARAPDGHTLVVARGRIDQETLAAVFLDEALEFLAVFLLFAAAAFALIWLIVGWSLRPLEDAAREAAAVGPANPSGRISADGLPSEVWPLVGAVNGALDRLDRAYVAQKRLTADAAHELRTPLAVLSLRLQRARIDATVDWPALEGDVACMKRLVDQLMTMARKEDPTRAGGDDPAGLPPINLSRVVREAAAMVLPLAEGSGRPIEVDAPDVVPVRGRPDDLRDAVRNLLDNALSHGAGTVRVNVGETRDGAGRRAALVEVADQGPGVPDELREAVFDRFRKVAPASPGAGLGLAIVRHVVRTHGGEVRIRPGGPGCNVQVSLPVSP
jgi:two-component system sensor histidine kinase QseC